MVAPRFRSARTRRGRRFLEGRESKIVENDKSALIIKGGRTNETVTNVLSELYLLKKPLAKLLKRKNPFHPFEDDTDLENFAMKFDSSLFLFGSNSKKHPNSLVFGRTYDYHVLDMVELKAETIVKASEFEQPRPALGTKPCIILNGFGSDSGSTLMRVGNLMVDWFRGPSVEKIRLKGLEVVVTITAIEKKLLLRVYKISLKKSVTKLPYVGLVEIGPRIDFSLGRTKLASGSLYDDALKRPKQLTTKPRKNTSTNVFGTKLARVHLGKQNVEDLQVRKMKALRKTENSDQN